MTAREALKTYFGYDDFRPLQEEIRRDEQKAFAVLLYDTSQDKAKARKRVSDKYPYKEFVMDVYHKTCDFLGIGAGN